MLIKLPKRQIVHLHSHTEYSLLDGIQNASEFVKAAKEKGLDAYTITEHGNCASAMGFYLDAIKPDNNIKPIFGLEAYVVEDVSNRTKEVKSSHLVLVARTNDGFHNLLKLSHISWAENFYYKPKLDYKNLKEHAKGLTALTACSGGVISNQLRFNGYKAAKEKVYELKEIFKNQLYLEMQVMEEVYAPDLIRIEKKIKTFKDATQIEEKLEFLKKNKSEYVELLERHFNSMKIQDDYEEKMRTLLGDSWLDQASVNKYMYKLSKATDTPYIVTGDCHYPRKGNHKLQDLVIRVGFGNWRKARQGSDEKSQSTGRGYYSSELYVKNNKDFEESRKKWHPYMPKKVLVEAIKATHKVADQVKTSIPIGQHQLPEFDLKRNSYYKEDDTKEKLFNRIVQKGFKKLVIPKIKQDELDVYEQRLKYELDTITQAHFIDYFLIIEDIVKWARKNNIHCVARGSVAGSLVAYALDITGINPIQYKLLFERFLNPTRVSGERAKAADALPDIDLDFERFGRNRVKQYIVDTYGEDRVCTIGAYGTMGTKGLIKDFSRVSNYKINGVQYDYKFVNKLTSSIDMGVTDIEECCQTSEEFAQFYEKHKGWFETFIRPMVGNIRSMSRHAAGVLITPTPFTEWIPIRTQNLEEEDEFGETKEVKIVISQWEDTYCERRGLLKLDILGVKQLDVFHRCLDLIKKRHGFDIKLDEVDIHDENVFARFHEGDNFGVFQFNSNLQSGYMREMKPDTIEDLCASNALLRPGPMQAGAHEMFIELKKGDVKPEYDHECVIPYLKSTYGLMIYQEQVMQVANVLGGLTLSKADEMRSAIKKKDPKLMEPFEKAFVEGCRKNGLSSKQANRVWDKIKVFSGYGFNLSHAATYALEGYYCQWLKTYFPNEFYAATLEFAADDVKKNENIYTHRRHASEEGIGFINPNVNKSTVHFDVTKKGSIVWPLRAIKGVGGKAALEIHKAQPFTSFEDFYERVTKRIVNKRVVERLIPAGCFKQFGTNEELLELYCKLKKEKKGISEEFMNMSKLDWKKKQDTILGYISNSYKELFRDEFNKNVMTYEEYLKIKNRGRVYIGGIVKTMREHKANNGKMCFFNVEDKNEKYEVVAFASFYQIVKQDRRPFSGYLVEVKGSKGFRNGKPQIILGNPAEDKLKIISGPKDNTK